MSSSILPPYTTDSTTSSVYPSIPIIPTTTGSAPVVTAIAPGQRPGISTGVIIGIVLAALVALIAALVGALLIQKRRSRVSRRTSDTKFNPVNLEMQDNRYPTSAVGGGGSEGSGGSGGSGGQRNILQLNGHGSAEPLSAAMMGVNGISGANGLGSPQNGQYYPYENDPQFHHDVAFQHGPGIGYMPPTEQGYAPYDEYDPYDTNYAAQQQLQDDNAAYLQQYQQQRQQHLYQLPLQNEQNLNAPVTYFDPPHQDVNGHGAYSDMTSGEIYYPDHRYTVGSSPVLGEAVSDSTMQHQQQHQQQQHQEHQADSYGMLRDPMRSNSALMSMVLGGNSSSTAETSVRSPEENPEYGIISPTSIAASRRLADESLAGSSSYADAESYSHNTNSEPRPGYRPSMTSIGSLDGSLSPKRNPQGLVKGPKPRIPFP